MDMRTGSRVKTTARPPCPVCGADNALRRRGRYHDAPPWPLRWLTVFLHDHVAQIYVCMACHKVVSLRVVQGRGPVAHRDMRFAALDDPF